jgi:flavin reductase (DIM6/NTAB) family NADH-FMN oxidoreductase RutF
MPTDTPDAADHGIDAKTFWQAIGCRAIGSAVVTAKDADGPAGFLALSATHLSADPPRMMVSVDMKTSALRAIVNARHFAINYLSRGQEELNGIFGGRTGPKGADRFKPEAWTTLKTGAPALVNAVGVLDCEVEETIERSGTVIVIGRLVAWTSAPDRDPIISFRGKWS